MVLSELGGHPAVNGLAHILFRGHEDGKKDEEESSVASTEAVDKVVVVPYFDLADLGDGSDHLLHVVEDAQEVAKLTRLLASLVARVVPVTGPRVRIHVRGALGPVTGDVEAAALHNQGLSGSARID